MTDRATLTDEQKRRAQNWVNERASGLTCPSCRHKNFVLGDYLIAPSLGDGSSVILGGTTYPLFVLFCKNCFHMMAYSAIATGIIEKSPTSENETEGGKE